MKPPSKLSFAHLPTPLEPMPRLTSYLGSPSIFIKRDDQTGLALGGNKTRKLEYLLYDAKANGVDTLITAGAVQSNHCRQTAAAAAKYGYDCILVLYGEIPNKSTGNLLLDQLLGAEIVWTNRDMRDHVLETTYSDAKRNGRNPYLIPYGGSNPIGAAAYAQAIAELIGQVRSGESNLNVFPEWIIFPSSSGGTQAGFVLGARLYGYTGKILGISVDEQGPVLQKRISDLASRTAQLFGEEIMFTPDEILVNDGFLGGGYGIVGDIEREAISIFASQEGILLDPVYTGRAAGGLISLIHEGFFQKTGQENGTILFWHTGGIPALFSDRYTLNLL